MQQHSSNTNNNLTEFNSILEKIILFSTKVNNIIKVLPESDDNDNIVDIVENIDNISPYIGNYKAFLYFSSIVVIISNSTFGSSLIY